MEQAKLVFTGKPFPGSLMDQQQSFQAENVRLEADSAFQTWLQNTGKIQERARLLVFSPSHFMYWYGLVSPQPLTPGAGLLAYELPAAQIAQRVQSGDLAAFDRPLSQTIPDFLHALTQQGVAVYQNLGDSPTPYLLETLDLDKQKLTQSLYLGASH